MKQPKNYCNPIPVANAIQWVQIHWIGRQAKEGKIKALIYFIKTQTFDAKKSEPRQFYDTHKKEQHLCEVSTYKIKTKTQIQKYFVKSDVLPDCDKYRWNNYLNFESIQIIPEPLQTNLGMKQPMKVCELLK